MAAVADRWARDHPECGVRRARAAAWTDGLGKEW